MSANLVILFAILCVGTVVLATKSGDSPAGVPTLKPADKGTTARETSTAKPANKETTAQKISTAKPADAATTDLPTSTAATVSPNKASMVENASIFVVPGRAYRFDCVTKYSSDPVWLLNNRTANLNDSRFVRHSKPNHSLEIKNATEADKGQWSCATIVSLNGTLGVMPNDVRYWVGTAVHSGCSLVAAIHVSSLMLCGLFLRFPV